MFIIQLGDRFAFCHRPTKGNGMFTHFTLNSLITPYGFLIPVGAPSFNVLDRLEGIPILDAMLQPPTAAYIVDSSGVARDVFMGPTSSYTRRLPTAEGVFSARSEDGDVEVAILSAYELSPHSLEGIVERLLKTYPMPADCVTYISMADIKRLLKGKKSKPLVIKRPPPETTQPK